MLKIFFRLHQELIKENQNQSLKKVLQKEILRRAEVAKFIGEEKNIINKLYKEYFTIYQSRSHMYKKLRKTEGEKNEDQVYLIKEVLNRMEKAIKNVSENKTFKIKENKKKINIVERILYFNQLERKGQRLEILTPNQMLRRLPITLAQLKAENNSEKLKNEIWQIIVFFVQIKKTYKKCL